MFLLGVAFAQAPPAQAAGYTLVFSDDFNAVDVGNGAGPVWHNGLWYRVKAPDANITAAGGILTLTWTQAQTDSYGTEYNTLARDRSQWRAFRYGYYESRFKWDVGSVGAYSAFWLDSVLNATNANKVNGNGHSCEIDIFEGTADFPIRYFWTIHDWHQNQGVSTSTFNSPNFTILTGTDFSQFHKYGALWIPGSVVFYYDDVAISTVPTPAICDNDYLYLLLSMIESVGFQRGNTTGVVAPTLNMNIDYVRVWQNIPLVGPGK